MNPGHRLLFIGIGVLLFMAIFYFVRKGKLREKYAVSWLLTGLSIIFFSIFDKALFVISDLLGIKTPINTMFFWGIFFVIAMNLHLNIMISEVMDKNKDLVQRIGLLESDMETIRKRKSA